MSHYKILGISREATKAAIRAAYLQKAKRYHPDVNQSPQAEKLFKSVQEAYQVLSDESKRRDFDSANQSVASSGSTVNAAPLKKQTPKYKGQVYDPEQERSDFSREFYEQAEQLRREMENDRPISSFRHHAKQIVKNLFWKTLPYVLISSISFLFYRRYKRSMSASREQSSVLHDMYGRAYMTDQFGRRVRTPSYDDKKRVAQWKAHKLAEQAYLLDDSHHGKSDTVSTITSGSSGSGGPITIRVTLNDEASDFTGEDDDMEPLQSQITFTAFDRIGGRKRFLSGNDSSDDYGPDRILPTVRPVVSAQEKVDHAFHVGAS